MIPRMKTKIAATGERYNFPVIPRTGKTDTMIIQTVYNMICVVAFRFFSPVGNILKPAFLYSSSNNQPMAQKCGNCQKNCNMNNMPGSIPNFPVAATQPNINGIAPGNAPTKTTNGVTGFKGVYILV